MAFNPAPSGYFPGINTGAVVSGATGVFIPYSALENYNTSTSGDIRQLVYAFNDAVATTYLNLSTANKPSEMTIRLSETVPSTGVLRKTYTNILNLALTGNFTVAYESGV